MKKLLFSVIIPCFNRATSLYLTLESCLQQSFSSYEVIIIDDCSTEDIKTIFVEYKEKFQTLKNVNLRYFRLEANGGPSKARNFAWEKSEGEYLAFLDSDDLWHPEKLNICAFFIDKVQPKCLYHNYSDNPNHMDEVIDSSLFRTNWKNTFSGLIKNYSTTPSFIVFRSISARFNESMRFNEDYDLWLRLSFTNRILSISGPPLTILGRPPSSPGGLSEHKIKMRLGEMKMYTNICREHTLISPILPILIILSILKHLYATLRFFYSSLFSIVQK